MKYWDFTQRKFLSLQEAHQHKKASELLKEVLSSPSEHLKRSYREAESWLEIEPIDLENTETLTHRFHLHIEKAGLCFKEHNLLQVKTQDKESFAPFLPINIVLCSLRSAFNVGSIIRTVEAFRLGTLHCFGTTPTPGNPKVQKSSMRTFDKVPWLSTNSLEDLPRPWIALETASPSSPLTSFTFPPSFTLFLGNEELGVPKEILLRCDAILEIPLYGSKNSLNVASAFAIAASNIRAKLDNL